MSSRREGDSQLAQVPNSQIPVQNLSVTQTKPSAPAVPKAVAPLRTVGGPEIPFILSYPQQGILGKDQRYTSADAISQKLKDLKFYWPVPAVWCSSHISPMLQRCLTVSLERDCKNSNRVENGKLCDVIGLIPLHLSSGSPGGKNIQALLVRIKHLHLLSNGVQASIEPYECFLNQHQVCIGRNQNNSIEWSALPSLGVLKLDLEKMVVVEVGAERRLTFTSLPHLLSRKCRLESKHSNTKINQLIGTDETPFRPSNCLNIWHKPASPRAKKAVATAPLEEPVAAVEAKRDASPQRPAKSAGDKPKKAAANLEKINLKKEKAKLKRMKLEAQVKALKQHAKEAKLQRMKALESYIEIKEQLEMTILDTQ